jgi:CRISPR/Cas system CSM-associated protein Csm3 (group 7 of RAMP superfamily)
MNIAGLLAGDMIGKVGMNAASKLLQGVFKGNSNFAALLGDKTNSSNKVQIDDMNLSKEEELELNKIRELAMNKGLTDIEVIIDGSKFNLNVKENSLSALVS